MSSARILVIGTGNAGKLQEIRSILGSIAWQIRSLRDFSGIESPAETGSTYAENASLKAVYYASALGEWALADDSGLEVAALNGAPGLYSARYAGEGASDSDRRQLLLAELRCRAMGNRSARFVCAVGIAAPDGTLRNISEGICSGRIIDEERGDRGFGYDPLFCPDGYEQTFAQLSEDVKDRISHRSRALAGARKFLQQLKK